MIMSLTVQQLLSDAKRLSTRLRDHDQTADTLITRAQDVLKQVDAMRQYQEDVDNLNEVAHNRPRAQLVLGIQQENRHIRTLQQENKELRAALEEHQNALELIMSKYRHHVTRLVTTSKLDIKGQVDNEKLYLLAEKTEKVCEMAAVMKEAVKADEENSNLQQETMARLVTENKGLRELLDISQKSNSTAKVKKVVSSNHKEVQTEHSGPAATIVEQEVTVTLPMPPQPKPPPRSPKVKEAAVAGSTVKAEAAETLDVRESLEISGSEVNEMSSGDETGSEDESIKYDTIKKGDFRKHKVVADPEPNAPCDDNPPDLVSESKTEAEELKLNLSNVIKEAESETENSNSGEQRKLSPSEEVVVTLVDQLVSDSVPEDGEETVTETADTGSVDTANTKSGGGAVKGKGKKQSKNSPRKGGKK